MNDEKIRTVSKVYVVELPEMTQLILLSALANDTVMSNIVVQVLADPT